MRSSYYSTLSFVVHIISMFFKKVLTRMLALDIIAFASRFWSEVTALNGVWLSLARAPGLGPGGRRFESCHPDHNSE